MQREPQRIIGESSSLFETLEHASLLASLNRPVLVVGERGSGKELIAERLHYLSPRWEQALTKVNCAAISEQLLDAELFGHEKGAFTGADKTHYGRFERTNGGTLFLDELGTMPVRLQEKLLRVIEYGEFERVGGQQTVHVDVRIVAATNANLPEMVRQKQFREDLLDRLAFDVVHVPPLRERSSDILELAEYFAVKMSHELGWEYYSGFTDKAKQQLLTYLWPGNIRELKNAVERSVYRWGNCDTAVDDVILNPFDRNAEKDVLSINKVGETTLEQKEEGCDKPKHVTVSASFESQVKAYKINLLHTALVFNQHHQKKTAEYLGLTYHQFRALLKKYKTELS